MEVSKYVTLGMGAILSLVLLCAVINIGFQILYREKDERDFRVGIFALLGISLIVVFYGKDMLN